LQSPQIYDELQLLILKFTVEKLNFEVIPKQIYFYLIAFINENVHGLNAGIPFDRYFVLENLATLLRQNEMPESLEFFKENKESFQMTIRFKLDIDADLDFLHSKPTKEEIRDRFAFDSSDVSRWLHSSQFTPFIVRSVAELFVDEIPSEQLILLYPNILSKKPFLDKLVSLPGSQEIIKDFISRSNFHDCAAFCAIYEDAFHVELAECYLYSRNVLKEFSFDDLQLESFAALEFFYISSHYDIYLIDMVKAILGSGLLSNQQDVLEGLRCCTEYSDIF
jgi:hypothetical protein